MRWKYEYDAHRYFPLPKLFQGLAQLPLWNKTLNPQRSKDQRMEWCIELVLMCTELGWGINGFWGHVEKELVGSGG